VYPAVHLAWSVGRETYLTQEGVVLLLRVMSNPIRIDTPRLLWTKYTYPGCTLTILGDVPEYLEVFTLIHFKPSTQGL